MTHTTHTTYTSYIHIPTHNNSNKKKICMYVYTLLNSPGCPRTHYLDQTGLKLGDAPASASGVLASKVRGATHSLEKKSLFKTEKKNVLVLNISACQN